MNANKILAVPLNVRVSAGEVSAVGATRRIRALYALGHLNWVIAQEAGISRDAVSALSSGLWATLNVAADDGVRAAYDRLSMKTGTSWKTRRLAEREGWVPPLAWDDDTIDDPTAVPQTDAPAPAPTDDGNAAARWLMGESVILSRAERNEVLQHLFEWTTDTKEEIAARLEMSPEAAERQWHRLQQKAAADGRRLWRRAWAYRDKDLTKNEMGAAA
ncbi:hypothetical protein AB0R01_30850 [Streptomyces rochei]|uniref:hypothetical protein n=1 Tax=Streptomyces rochei TaxID=1928 RepID=UPI0034305E42